MVYESNLCVNCYKPIGDPICVNCYMNELSEILGAVFLNQLVKKLIFSRLKKILPEESMNENLCIHCGKNVLSTCSRCFLYESFNVIKGVGLDAMKIREMARYLMNRFGHEIHFENPVLFSSYSEVEDFSSAKSLVLKILFKTSTNLKKYRPP